MIGAGDPGITLNEKRDVGDAIRYLGYGNAFLCSLIKGLILDSKTGKMKETGGLIKKEAVESMRIENYSRSARPLKFTVTGGTAVTTPGFTLSAVNGLNLRQELHNPRNGTSCRVESISTLTILGTSVGSTTFSCVVGDELVAGATAIPEGFTSSIVMNGNDDHSFNILKYSRGGVSITDIMKAIPALAGGDRLAREKLYMVWEYLARIDNDLIHGHKTTNSATLNYTTGVTLVENFTTSDGLIALAGNSWDMGGSFSLDALQTTLPQNMGSIYNENEPVIGICGNAFYGRLQQAIRQATNNNHDVEKGGILEKFGIKSTKLVTDGPEIEFMKHNAMNNNGSENKLVLVAPSNITYCHLKGWDMVPRTEIQDKKTLGQEDEIVTTFGLRTEDAGQTITVVTNCF
jgi:hypothetical protein